MLKILIVIGLIQGIVSTDEKQAKDNNSSLDQFKEKLIDFINENGGLENLGRAAGSVYNDQYKDLKRNPSFSFPQQDDKNDDQVGYGPQYNGYDQNRYGYGQGYDGSGYAQGYYGYGQQNFIPGQPIYNQQGNGQSHLNYLYGQGGYGQQYGYNDGQFNYGYNDGQFNYGYNDGQFNYGYDQQNYNGQQYGFPIPQRYPLNKRYPIRKYPRPGYRPPGYEPGFLEALSSISRHDDLRCVPKILCEVASSGRAPNREDSFIPFTNRESLVSLLTVLNFVDNSPLMNFGRAALLGYAGRGDSRTCLQAYPTCPRDPDRLIEYLNNHNGGFFRFFQGAPNQFGPSNGESQNGLYGGVEPQNGYGQNGVLNGPNRYGQNYYGRPFPDSYNQYNRPNKFLNYSPGYSQYRILSKPDISSTIFPTSSLQYTREQEDVDYFNIPPSRKTKKLSFPNDSPKYTIAKPLVTNDNYQINNYPYKDQSIVKPIKGQYFLRPASQFFPDNTITENYLQDYQQTFKKPFYNIRGSKQIHFPNSNRVLSEHYNRMVFPEYKSNTNFTSEN